MSPLSRPTLRPAQPPRFFLPQLLYNFLATPSFSSPCTADCLIVGATNYLVVCYKKNALLNRIRNQHTRQSLGNRPHKCHSPDLDAPHRRTGSHVLRGFDKDQGLNLRHELVIGNRACLDYSSKGRPIHIASHIPSHVPMSDNCTSLSGLVRGHRAGSSGKPGVSALLDGRDARRST